jgi:hypothetical protein
MCAHATFMFLNPLVIGIFENCALAHKHNQRLVAWLKLLPTFNFLRRVTLYHDTTWKGHSRKQSAHFQQFGCNSICLFFSCTNNTSPEYSIVYLKLSNRRWENR